MAAWGAILEPKVPQRGVLFFFVPAPFFCHVRRSPFGRPKWPQRSPKGRPGTPKATPRAPQGPPKAPQGRPRGPKRHPKAVPEPQNHHLFQKTKHYEFRLMCFSKKVISDRRFRNFAYRCSVLLYFRMLLLLMVPTLISLHQNQARRNARSD